MSYKMNFIFVVPAAWYAIRIAKNLSIENFTESSGLVEDLIWVFLVEMLGTIHCLGQRRTEFSVSQTIVFSNLIDPH